jgi:hypothetical protein
MTELESIIFYRNAEIEIRDLLIKIDHPDPITRSFTVVTELKYFVDDYKKLWEARL